MLVASLVMVAAWPVEVALAQGTHSHPGHGLPDLQGLATGVSHGAAQAAAVFLAGLATFVALVWLPSVGTEDDGAGLFARWTWVLFGLLTVAGVFEISLYAVRASGQPFSHDLFGQALFETRVGHVWLARFGLGLVVALAASWAAWSRRPVYWWVAAGAGSFLLVTLTLVSHAAAEQRLLPFMADWVHVIAGAFWMGGLLGFPIVLLGPLRAMPQDLQSKVRRKAVGRFSRVATVAVMVLVSTGLYASLIHVPSLSALFASSYGLALIVKLGLLVFLLAAGAANLKLQGRAPFGRVVGTELILAAGIFIATGFLTSLPPPGP